MLLYNEGKHFAGLASPHLYTPSEAEKFINTINDYAHLPIEIYQQLKVACGVSLIRDLKSIQVDITRVIQQGEFEQALALLKSTKNDLTESVKSFVSSFSEMDQNDLYLFCANEFKQIEFSNFDKYPELEKSLNTSEKKEQCMYNGFKKAILCFEKVTPTCSRYKSAKLEIATLLHHYLVNGRHSESESISIKKEIIDNALKAEEYRFLYSLLHSFNGRKNTQCSLASNANLVDLLFLLSTEQNSLSNLLSINNADTTVNFIENDTSNLHIKPVKENDHQYVTANENLLFTHVQTMEVSGQLEKKQADSTVKPQLRG